MSTELSGLAMPPADFIGGVRTELLCTVLTSPFRLGLDGAASLKADCDVEPDSLKRPHDPRHCSSPDVSRH